MAAAVTIADGLFQVPANGARVTVIEGAGGVMVVDAGARGSLRRIVRGLEEVGLSPDGVDLIALTHYHPDHSGGLGELVEATQAKVAAHALEAGIISGQQAAPDPYQNRVVARISDPFVKRLYGRPVEIDHVLEDGQYLPIDEPVRVIHTPGHTKGSICLLVESKRTLVVGDVLQYRFKRLGPPSKSVTADYGQALESLERLRELDFDTICFSHFDPLRRSAKDSLMQLIGTLSV